MSSSSWSSGRLQGARLACVRHGRGARGAAASEPARELLCEDAKDGRVVAHARMQRVVALLGDLIAEEERCLVNPE